MVAIQYMHSVFKQISLYDLLRDDGGEYVAMRFCISCPDCGLYVAYNESVGPFCGIRSPGFHRNTILTDQD